MAFSAALALNVTGHLVGTALYAMLVGLVVAPPPGAARPVQGPWWAVANRLTLLTGVLGVTWNVGALVAALFTLSDATPPAALLVLAYGALGCLPAVVVHSVVRATPRITPRVGRTLRWCAYAVVSGAAVRHLVAAASGGAVPDPSALLWVTVGATILLLLLLIATRATADGRRLWIVGLAVFAVSGFHLTGHDGRDTWWTALVGHHASLPLAIAILQQEYRFAFADLFVKRALAMLLLATGLLVAWAAAASVLPLDRVRLDDAVTFAVLLGLWLSTSLLYPWVRRSTDRFVDACILRRANASRERDALAAALTDCDTEAGVLQVLDTALRRTFDAHHVDSSLVAVDDALGVGAGGRVVFVPPFPSVAPHARRDGAALIVVPTVHPPRHVIALGTLQHGRRLWSDDLDLLETVAYLAARRIDAVRDEQRRLRQAVRDQELGRLATEAELRAVRAQLHPHFLFNALNTIHYLIEASPARAGQVLMELTGLLRGVLRRSADEFSTLGEEIELVRSYLAIEQARFEARLGVDIDVAASLHGIVLPSLLLQPLVENAVRHGIGPARRGGRVRVTAALAPTGDVLDLQVEDSGVGGASDAFTRDGGVGLASVRRRLALHYGDAAGMTVQSRPGSGTTVRLALPITDGARLARPAPAPGVASTGALDREPGASVSVVSASASH